MQNNDNIPNMFGNKKRRNKKYAFTLAEVLITLGIIGIVAALIMPAVITNVNKKAWNEAQFIVRRKMQEATNQMKTTEKLHGYKTTEEFVKELKKYMKFVQVCDNTNLQDCYAPKVVLTAEEEVEVSELIKSKNLGHEDYNTNTMGLVIADGTTIIMAYDPKCPFIEPTNNTIDTLSCVSMIYDINGKKKPNKIGDDITAVNATISGCDMKAGRICIAASDLSYSPIDTCAEGSGDPNFTQAKVDARWGSGSSACQRNYWYGAKKSCEAQGMRLPTLEELNEIYQAVKFHPSKYGFTPNGLYWSSSGHSDPVLAWFLNLNNGDKVWNFKSVPNFHAHCVR